MTDMLGSELYVVSDSPLSVLDFWRPYNIMDSKYEYIMRRWNKWSKLEIASQIREFGPNHMAGTFLHMPES